MSIGPGGRPMQPRLNRRTTRSAATMATRNGTTALTTAAASSPGECSTRDFRQRNSASTRLLPITLGGLRKSTGHQMPPPQQLKYMSEDTARWARQYGVPMQIPAAFPVSTIKALRACIAAKSDKAMHALFRAYWGEG